MLRQSKKPRQVGNGLYKQSSNIHPGTWMIQLIKRRLTVMKSATTAISWDIYCNQPDQQTRACTSC